MSKMAASALLVAAAAAATSVTTTAIEGWTYVGCVDTYPGSYPIPVDESNGLTHEICQEECATHEFTLVTEMGCGCSSPDVEADFTIVDAEKCAESNNGLFYGLYQNLEYDPETEDCEEAPPKLTDGVTGPPVNLPNVPIYEDSPPPPPSGNVPNAPTTEYKESPPPPNNGTNAPPVQASAGRATLALGAVAIGSLAFLF
ncbi:hypothetical protein IMZ48_20270 [Candidatus Bathyarchaeota archaeon]|nr:hypothetical protein [Candidatus Bathyarchaeota archaeon]